MKYWNGLEEYDGNRIAVMLGKFDGLHFGHRTLLRKMQEHADGLEKVILAFDFPNAGAGRELYTREEQVYACAQSGLDGYLNVTFDDTIRTMPAEVFLEEILFKRLKASQVYVGEEFRFGFERKGDVSMLRAFCEENRISCYAVPELLHEGIKVSSSDIRTLIAAGRMAEAAELGGAFFVHGITRKGRQLGRTMNFPTLNLYPPVEKLLPPAGVYLSDTLYEGTVYPSVTNIGVNPTVKDDARVSVETHLLSYPESGIAYGAEITVYFGEQTRPERRFGSVEELFAQIAKDAENARNRKKPIYI